MRVPLAVLLACFLFLPSIGTAAPTLDDPEMLYMLAVKSQGLNFPGVKPWHIKASYILFDAKGKNPVNGVFEEWYVGPHRYKRSYTRPGFTQTDYGTDAGLYRSGEQKWPHARGTPDSHQSFRATCLIYKAPKTSLFRKPILLAT